jgi:ribulose-bisphosphate carboxylase large chain
VGRVTAIERDPEGGHRVLIAYPAAAAADDPAQLLNLLFGNASLQGDVELLDVEVPAGLRELLGGPRHGIEGIRAAVGVADRPLSCAVLKPMGLEPQAGIDVIKDDHGLADAGYCPLEARLEACLAAIERAADATGRRAIYAPNLIGPPAALARQLEAAERWGAGAVVFAPFVVGLPAFHELARRASLPILAHPALTGGSRIAMPLLLGTLFRLYGADAVVFPHAGGRFPFDDTLCRDLADRLRRRWTGIRPALPVPAGGMSVERMQELFAFYGSDMMLLVGGTLYRAGERLGERAREFVDRVQGAARAVEELPPKAVAQ